jgi:hypothetical protein
VKTAALVAMLAVPSASIVDSSLSVTRSDRYTPQVYVQTGQQVDIALPAGESITSNPFTSDGRWSLTRFADGVSAHVVAKPEPGASPQRLFIPTSYKTIRIMLVAGNAEGRIVTVIVSEPSISRPVVAYHPAPSVTPVALRPRPASTPRVLAIKSCDGLDSNYSWHGDSRIDLVKACEDRTHSHTFLLMREGRNPPGVVPFKVDSGGRQDQIRNATFVPATGIFPQQWVIDGVSDRWALLADSSSGQIRTEITHVGSVGVR